MTETLAQWLDARSDAELAELLRLRPDLTVPLPASMNILAGRAEQRASVVRVADDFDTADFVVIDAMLAAQDAAPHDTGRTRAQVRALLPGDPAIVDAVLNRLAAAALIWGDPELRITPAAATTLPWPPTTPDDDKPDESLTEDEINAALARINHGERTILERLARTAPIGRTKDAAPGTPADRPIQRLLAQRLLTWVDDQTVVLPATVGRIVRGEPITDPRSLTAPPLPTAARAPRDVDGAAAGEVLELLRNCTDVIAVLGEQPAPTLKAGGMGVRELRRIAKQTGIGEERLGLLVELLWAAGLICSGKPDPLPDSADAADDYWTPTVHVDAWLDAPAAHRWTLLAGAWLELTRRPSMIGMRDAADKPIAALSDEVRSPTAARDRRIVLELLADLAPGHAPDPTDIATVLSWRRPRWKGRFRGDTIERTLAEATTLGVVGRGALSTPGRVLLADGDAVAAMAKALPAPVDYVLVQADLTIVAPGPLTPELAHRIIQVADLESAGGAGVYRVSETTVRRALDAGATTAELHALFADHSRTPVPQALTYLIDDVGRRHGKLRAGMASSFLRCDDPAQLAEVLASPVAEALALRGIAPTVAISPAPLGEVLGKLRAAGFAPAGEDSRGAIVNVRARGARILNRRPRAGQRPPQPPSDDQLQQTIDQLRANDRAAKARRDTEARGDGSRTGGAAIMTLLQLAVRVRRNVNITYVDAQGTATRRIVEPLAVGNGQLDAYDKTTDAVRHFALHRIAAVSLMD